MSSQSSVEKIKHRLILVLIFFEISLPILPIFAFPDSTNIVLTPFGPAEVSHVHEVPSGSIIVPNKTHVVVYSSEGRKILEVKLENYTKEAEFIQLTEPTYSNTHWIEWAEYNHNSELGSFDGYWNVPTSPSKDGSLIYLFIGLMPKYPSSNAILQSVLQWGYNTQFGGNYWVVSAWFVYGNQYIYSTPKTVYFSEKLHAVITRGLAGNPNAWGVGVYVYSGSSIRTYTYLYAYTGGYSGWTRALVLLEGWNVYENGHLPGDTTFYNLALYDYNSNQVKPSWQGKINSLYSYLPDLNVVIVSPYKVILET